MASDIQLGNMWVAYKADLTNLQSGLMQAKTDMSSADAIAQSTGSSISSAFTQSGEAILAFSEQAMEVEPILLNLGGTGEEAGAELGESIASASDGFASFQDALSSLTASVGDAVAQIKEQLDSVPAEAEEDAAKSQSAFAGFDMGGMINQAGMTVFSLQALGNMAAQAGQSLLGPAEQSEQTAQSFSNLLGSTQAATSELGKLGAFANDTQFKTQDIDNLSASMIAFKMPVQDIVPRLTAVGDALTAVGRGTPAEMQGVVDVLGKMSIQGKLTQGDITQLGAHGIDATSAIAQGMGISTTALQKMIKDGTLPANDAINALTKGIEGNPVYAGGMAKQAGTLSGQMSTLGSEWDQAMSSMMSPVLPELEKDFGSLGTMLTSPSFKQFATTMGKDIATGVKDVVTGVKDLIDTGIKLTDFFTHNQTAMNALVAVLIPAGAIITGVIVTSLISWAAAQWDVITPLLLTAAPFILIGAIAAAVIFGIIEAVEHWGQIAHWLQGIWGDVASFWHDDVTVPFQNGIGAVGSAFNGFGSVVHGIWDGISNTVKGGINTIIGGIDDFIGFIDGIQIHIPSVGVGPLKTPAFDWNGLRIPKIPLLSTGGTIPPGQFAIAGDPGPSSELVFGGTAGASVLSHAQSMAALAGGSGGGASGQSEIHIHIHMNSEEIAHYTADPTAEKIIAKLLGYGPVRKAA